MANNNITDTMNSIVLKHFAIYVTMLRIGSFSVNKFVCNCSIVVDKGCFLFDASDLFLNIYEALRFCNMLIGYHRYGDTQL
jgi:hypothetical protein